MQMTPEQVKGRIKNEAKETQSTYENMCKY